MSDAQSVHHKDRLLIYLKREVKQIMEEAALKRYIYEDGGSVISLCIAVESCLSHGLKRRVFGLFGTPSTFALLHRISKQFEPAVVVLKMVIDIERAQFKLRKAKKKSGNGSPTTATSIGAHNNWTFRNLWIRLALVERQLASIVSYIGENSEKFYEPDALMRDPISATEIADLLVGPCHLEYTKMKQVDHYWTDPPAEELIQRHRIHSRNSAATLYHSSSSCSSTMSPKSPRPPLQIKRTESLGPDDLTQKISASAREYVMLLHQNTKTSLLYGKNGVVVCPPNASRPMRGYLSLHQNANRTLTVKWTPNDLMNAGTESNQPSQVWRYALSVDVQNIVYIHYHHQSAESGGTVVFVGADGIQHPPLQFPTGQHPVAFLSCLENGIASWGYLDPPLWSQRGKGKVLPKLRRRSSFSSNGKATTTATSTSTADSTTNSSENCPADEYGDYVFRLVTVNRPEAEPPQSARKPKTVFTFNFKERLLSLTSSPTNTPPATPKSKSSQHDSSRESSPTGRAGKQSQHDDHQQSRQSDDSKNGGGEEDEDGEANDDNEENGFGQVTEMKSQVSAPARLESRSTLRTACHSMRYQILSRAFYGWLANCRHMKTIRTHLAGLVNREIVSADEPTPACNLLTKDEWDRLQRDKGASSEYEFYRRVYFGNMEHELRRDTWPILLGVYPWEADEAGRTKIYDELRTKYEESMSEWTSVEAIVRERDKEAFKAARGISDESRTSEPPLDAIKQYSVSNDVFVESEDEDRTEINGDDHGTDGTLVMDALDGLAGMTVMDVSTTGRDESQTRACRATKTGSGGLDSQGSTGIGTMEESDIGSPTRSTPEEGDGGLFSMHIIESFALNLHRIDKDVHRCDRHYPYFTNENLEKLKNVMCTYVWENLHLGYIQGMCDLAAVLLVIFDDEVLTYGCFNQQMKRMGSNFPHGGGMDIHLANMRAMLQVFDPELFELMQQNGDYTHFYFAYRWFLLDFKRELLYDDVFRVWEIIWASSRVASTNFILFISMACIEIYRDILLDHNMDFTDVIKFFNEMAEKHDAKVLLDLARNMILRLQRAVEK